MVQTGDTLKQEKKTKKKNTLGPNRIDGEVLFFVGIEERNSGNFDIGTSGAWCGSNGGGSHGSDCHRSPQFGKRLRS